jgi:hypothetical protein
MAFPHFHEIFFETLEDSIKMCLSLENGLNAGISLTLERSVF